jgi:hypothetical protein
LVEDASVGVFQAELKRTVFRVKCPDDFNGFFVCAALQAFKERLKDIAELPLLSECHGGLYLLVKKREEDADNKYKYQTGIKKHFSKYTE